MYFYGVTFKIENPDNAAPVRRPRRRTLVSLCVLKSGIILLGVFKIAIGLGKQSTQRRSKSYYVSLTRLASVQMGTQFIIDLLFMRRFYFR